MTLTQMLKRDGGAGSWRPGLQGLKETAKGHYAPVRSRDGFVLSMSSGELSDQANTGAGRHKPPVSCQLPQFAEGKAA